MPAQREPIALRSRWTVLIARGHAHDSQCPSHSQVLLSSPASLLSTAPKPISRCHHLCSESTLDLIEATVPLGKANGEAPRVPSGRSRAARIHGPSCQRGKIGDSEQNIRFSHNQGVAAELIQEELKYSRYLQVFNRVVEHPPHSSKPDATSAAQRTVAYDVVGARTLSCHFVAVVPYHSATRTVTLLTEYAQGANSLVYGVPCGGLSSYHTSLEDCATRELSEEARLKGGRLIRLLPEGHPGLLEVKWCKNRFTPYLVVDPEPDTDPHPRDLEEFIEVHEVDLPTLKRLMYGGDMMLPSIVSCGMALDYLQENKLL